MSARLDLELRVYLTARPGGQLEWQVVAVEADGQTRWCDGQVSPYMAHTPVIPHQLARRVSLELRRVSRACREFG